MLKKIKKALGVGVESPTGKQRATKAVAVVAIISAITEGLCAFGLIDSSVTEGIKKVLDVVANLTI